MPLKLPFEARKSASSVISRGILLCLLNFILRHEKVSHLLYVEAFFFLLQYLSNYLSIEALLYHAPLLLFVKAFACASSLYRKLLL